MGEMVSLKTRKMLRVIVFHACRCLCFCGVHWTCASTSVYLPALVCWSVGLSVCLPLLWKLSNVFFFFFLFERVLMTDQKGEEKNHAYTKLLELKSC